MTLDRPRTGLPYLDEVLDAPGSVLALAHRGGARHPDLSGLENTLAAFRHAVSLGYGYIETDVHATADGVLVVHHDADLDRMTDSRGSILHLTAAEVATARVQGTEPIPTMAEVFEEFPDIRFNIDLKEPPAVGLLADLIERTGSHDRVCVASFDRGSIEAFRRATAGRVATAAAKTEVLGFLIAPAGRRAGLHTGQGWSVLQLPRVRGPIPVVTAGLVRRAHAAGVHVHVWTVNQARHMENMIDIGVDGIFTDRTDVLKDVISARGLWRDFA